MNNNNNNTMIQQYLNTNKTQREKKNIYENVIHNNSFKAKLNSQFSKNDKPILLNNQNHIKSINIINNNYNNIIINNKLTPNKKVLLEDRTFSINKKNYKILTFGNKQNGNLDRNKALKLVIDNQEQENDCNYKYKLLVNEKNNLINKLKNEVAYYKNRKKNKSPVITNNNTINIELNNKKNLELENIRNKIQNIFSHHKKDLKLDTNNILNHNINNYHTIKTYAYNNNNSNTNNAGSPKNEIIPHIFQNKALNINKTENYKYNNKLIFNYSLKNDLKLKNNKLTIDLNNNYNSIEANTNRAYKYTVKSPKLTFTINSINKNKGNNLDFNNNSINCNAITYEESIERKDSQQNLKKSNNYYNGFSPSSFSLKKERINKIMYDNNYNFDSFMDKDYNNNTISSSCFNYKDNFQNLKKRMTNLIENLFDIIELQKNQK
jgi:hypothetical protein